MLIARLVGERADNGLRSVPLRYYNARLLTCTGSVFVYRLSPMLSLKRGLLVAAIRPAPRAPTAKPKSPGAQE